MNCIYCKSKDVVKNGFRSRKIITKQSYFCNDCKKQFVEPDGFERMRYSPEIIKLAVHMHINGFSLGKIQNHLLKQDGIKVTRWTISKWTKKNSVYFRSDK